MIVLIADVLLLDMKYTRDARFVTNRQVLDHLRIQSTPVSITCHTLLEILGVACFNSSAKALRDLADEIPVDYGLIVLPAPAFDLIYAGLDYQAVRDRIATRLSIGDAVTALQIEPFIPTATTLLTWNARHFRGKLSIPVLTPEEGWQQNQPAT